MKVFRPFSAVVMSLLLAACAGTVTDTDGNDAASSSSSIRVSVSSSSVSSADDDGSNASAGASVGGGVITPRVITMTVHDWSFAPNTISMKKGEKVTLRITGVEGTHGFAIADLGINTAIAAGKTVEIEIPTDKTGTFTFFCSVPCGSGHRDMKGTITISE